MKKTPELLLLIREKIVNTPSLLSSSHYELLCAALDIISDAEEGVYYYLNLEETHERGINYIYIYGLFTLLSSKINSVKTLRKIINKKETNIRNIDELEIIRLIRNKFFAHPAEFSQNNSNNFGIHANSLTTFSFSPYVFKGEYQDNDESIPLIKIKNIIEKNINYRGFNIDTKEIIKNMDLSLKILLEEILDELPKITDNQFYTVD